MNTLPFFRRVSTYLMELSVLITLSGIYLAYVANDRVSLASQVLGHLMVLLGPSCLKFGYVLQLAVNEESKPDTRRSAAGPALPSTVAH